MKKLSLVLMFALLIISSDVNAVECDKAFNQFTKLEYKEKIEKVEPVQEVIVYDDNEEIYNQDVILSDNEEDEEVEGILIEVVGVDE